MKKLYLIASFCVAMLSNAQTPGTLDTNFGTNGQVSTFTAQNYYPWSIGYQPYSGKIYTAGQADFNGSTYAVIGKYDFYGNLDTSFANNGYSMFILPGNTYQTAKEIKVFENDYFVLGTYKLPNNSNTYSAISKFDNSGNIITSFGNNGIINISTSSHIEIINDNIFAGNKVISKFNATTGIQQIYNQEMNTVNPNYRFYDIEVLDDGSQLFAGSITIDSKTYNYIEKHKTDGTFDTSFANGGKYIGDENSNPNGVWELKTQKYGANAGKIILLVTNTPVSTTTPILKRLNANGTPDTTFGINGNFIYPFISGSWVDRVLVKNGDEILLCGSNSNSNGTSDTYLMGVSSNGDVQYLTSNNNSSYSENWSMTTIPNSFVLTFGNTTDNTFTNFTNKIQRFYIEPPVISLIGDAYANGNWANDLVMSTTDNTTYTLSNVYLNATNNYLINGVKFRLDSNWFTNWGSDASGSFPIGTSINGNRNIAIPTSDYYDISFNIKTGVYNFTKHLATSEISKTEMVMFPNPAKEVLNFSEEVSDISITDFSGKMVKQLSSPTKSVNINNLAKGNYIITVTTKDGKRIYKKFIKE